VEARPHIGWTFAPVVAECKTIIAARDVQFGQKSLLPDPSVKVVGVKTEKGELDGPVVLATGHSAREMYQYLFDNGFEVEAKALAVGVRLEHPQELIDRIQYHTKGKRGPYLPPADYTFVSQQVGRGVYSFCMCPGGVIVPAGTEDGHLVVNGMSASTRSSRWGEQRHGGGTPS
jgi:uncharacterized FAD-dependent dehydrogenase